MFKFSSTTSTNKDKDKDKKLNDKDKKLNDNDEIYKFNKPIPPKVIGVTDTLCTLKLFIPTLVNNKKNVDDTIDGILTTLNDNEKWICNVCTYENDETAKFDCYLCTTPKPLPLSSLSGMGIKNNNNNNNSNNEKEKQLPINLDLIYEVQLKRHNHRLDSWISSGILYDTTAPLTNLKQNTRYSIKYRVACKPKNIDELIKKKKINTIDWSEFSDLYVIRTLTSDDQQRMENVLRVKLFLKNSKQLLSYPEDDAIPDTLTDKTVRSLDSILALAKYSGLAPTYVQLAKNAWRIQKTGVAGLIFKEELQQMVIALGTFAGNIASGVGLSSKDVTVGSYYMLWEKKRNRLLNPVVEKIQHEKDKIGVLKEEAPQDMLKELSWFLPLASMAYRKTPAQIQWVLDTFPSRISSANVNNSSSNNNEANITAASIARLARRKSSVFNRTNQTNPSQNNNNNNDKKTSLPSSSKINNFFSNLFISNNENEIPEFSPEYRLIACRNTAKQFKPAYFITANDKKKLCIISIRGTNEVEDVLTDSLCDVEEAKFTFHDGGLDGKSIGPQLFVHKGMLKAAEWLFNGNESQPHENNGPILDGAGVGVAVKEFHKKGYKVILTGHSLGGGVAVILSLLIADEIEDIKLKVIAYGTPACVDERIAEALKGEVPNSYKNNEHDILPDLGKRVQVVSLILRDDIVPRLSLLTARKFVVEVKRTRNIWEPLLYQDLSGFVSRAKTLFAPTQRAHYLEQGVSKRTQFSNEKELRDVKSMVNLKNEVENEDIPQDDNKEDDIDNDNNNNNNNNDNKDVDMKTNNENDKKKNKNKKLKKNQPSEAIQKAIEHPLVSPGLIAHIYQYRSTYHASLVDYRLKSLRKIEPYFTSIDNHKLINILESLRDVFSTRDAEKKGRYGPHWESINDHRNTTTNNNNNNNNTSLANKNENENENENEKKNDWSIECAVCRYVVSWHLTGGNNETSEIKASHHCYSCGLIVCSKCSHHKTSLPSIGINRLVRVCTDCYYKLTFNDPSEYSSLGIGLGNFKSWIPS